jgi:hypothetical protein
VCSARREPYVEPGCLQRRAGPQIALTCETVLEGMFAANREFLDADVPMRRRLGWVHHDHRVVIMTTPPPGDQALVRIVSGPLDI